MTWLWLALACTRDPGPDEGPSRDGAATQVGHEGTESPTGDSAPAPAPTSDPPTCEFLPIQPSMWFGYCLHTLEATLADDGPLDALWLTLTVDYVDEPLYDGPPGPDGRFVLEGVRSPKSDSSFDFVLLVSDATGEVGTCTTRGYTPDLFGYWDEDGDGYIIQQIGGVPNDCDDCDASVSPGATEVPGNGVDDDCDGQVD